MKKMAMVIMMIVVMMTTTIISALADTVENVYYNCRQSEMYKIVKELIHDYKPEEYRFYADEEVINGCAHFYGALEIDDFEKETGKDFSFQTWKEECEKQFNIDKFDVEIVDYVDGITFYTVYVSSKDDSPVYTKHTWDDNNNLVKEDFTKAKGLFALCCYESEEAHQEWLANRKATIYWEDAQVQTWD